MRHRQGAVLNTLDAIKNLITTEPALAAITTTSAMQTLTDTIAEFGTSVGVQDSSSVKSQGQTSKTKALVRDLRQKMQGVAAVARLKLKNTPEFSSLVMPPGNVTRAVLIARAHAMVDAATPHQDVFTATALPATFLTDLATAATNVQDTLTTRDTASGKRANATASLGQLEKDGVSVIKALDSLVQPLIVGNVGLQAQWAKTKRIPRKPGVVQSATSTPPATPIAPPAPPTAPPAPSTAPSTVTPTTASPATVAASQTITAPTTAPQPTQEVKPAA